MQRCYVNNHLSSASLLHCGVPQRSIIGPLLFLIYINDLPNCLNAGAPRICADDTNVTFSAVTIPDLEYQINSDLKYIDRWLKVQKFISSRQKLQSLNDYTTNIHLDGVPINQSNQSKSLIKISRGGFTFMKSLKKYPLVSVFLSGSGHLFQCILQLKYRKVLSSHTLIIAALYGMA